MISLGEALRKPRFSMSDYNLIDSSD